ncbi:hypothetical protein BIV25_07505 [Streptomyces sp. MUSC 14]|nr:hypothetical protein BIV25_07505 [Streptomyces sp. MUSC 14]
MTASESAAATSEVTQGGAAPGGSTVPQVRAPGIRTAEPLRSGAAGCGQLPRYDRESEPGGSADRASPFVSYTGIRVVHDPATPRADWRAPHITLILFMVGRQRGAREFRLAGYQAAVEVQSPTPVMGGGQAADGDQMRGRTAR